MAVNTGEIQPVAREVWVQPEQNRKDAQVIAPVAKTEGGTSRKVARDKTAKDAPQPTGEKNEFPAPEVSEQVLEFLRQANLQLDFNVDTQSGRTIVRVLDGETGEVVRQIPVDKLAKVEEFRGVLFDGKA
jgi:flagellar protein FlaG